MIIIRKLTQKQRTEYAKAYVCCGGDALAAAKTVGIYGDEELLKALPYEESMSKEIEKCLQRQISREMSLAALDACKTLHRILRDENSEAKEAATAAKEILSRFSAVQNTDILQSDSEIKLIFGEEYL